MAIGTGAAILGGAALGFLGQNKAANAQEDAARDAGQRSDAQFAQTRQDQLAQLAQVRADQAPYREAGYRTLEQIMAGLSDGGDLGRRFTLADYTADPGYAFRLEEGQKALDRAAAASGNAYSGAALKALARFNSGLASQEYGDAYNRFTNDQDKRFNRLASVAGIGQTALGATQNAGTNAYGNIASLGAANAGAVGRSLQDAAEARASGYVGLANTANSAIRSLYNNNLIGGGGSTGIAPSQSEYLSLWGV